MTRGYPNNLETYNYFVLFGDEEVLLLALRIISAFCTENEFTFGFLPSKIKSSKKTSFSAFKLKLREKKKKLLYQVNEKKLV